MPDQINPGDMQNQAAVPTPPAGQGPRAGQAAPQNPQVPPPPQATPETVLQPEQASAAPRKKRFSEREIVVLIALALAIIFAIGDAVLNSHPADEPPAITVQATAEQATTEQALPEEESTAANASAATSVVATPEQAAPRGGNWRDDAMPTEESTWNAAGLALMDQLSADPYYAGFTAAVLPNMPYLIAVNRAASCVTVYTADESGRYTVPFAAMVCSGGTDTPTGYYSTPINYGWRLLSGPCYGQYATRIWDAYLFHSVPYYTQHKDDLEYDQYNQLGTIASLGCIRLMVADVKWIYDNCPIGTPVIIYDDEQNPGPMGKPGTIYTDPADTTLRGWDPTDPDPANPWPEEYRDGTTIRCAAAQLQWSRAQDANAWASSLNPTDLQGFSTDSSVAGTRG